MLEPEITACLRRIRDERGNVVVLGGAGLSAQSGVPTFRGPGGYWTAGSRNYQPMELATAAAFSKMPREIWRWYLYRRTACRRAAPNQGHDALVRLESALGDRFALITQNVDGLHLRAGHDARRVFQIHGNIDFMRCALRCSDRLTPVPDGLGEFERDTELSDEVFEQLRCTDCEGPARPHVLWFDEYYDETLFFAETAMQKATAADLLIVVGTSGTTNLPMQIGAHVATRGVAMLDINPDENPFSRLATRSGGFHLAQDAASALPAVVELLVDGNQ